MNPPSPPSTTPDALLERLNPAQAQAVTHGGGGLLVLAGAGSGKTRVITHRIAHLIVGREVPPWRIVAVTFTNKAAGEMKERVERLLGRSLEGGWIGTFHALCLRILRRDGERIGLRPGFNIYDSADQLSLVKRILREETGSDDNAGTPRSFLSRISRAKNAMQSVGDMEKRAFSAEAKLAARIYARYQEQLRASNAVDFDDLLLRTLDLFRDHEEVRQAYGERCEHLLVDEYQDTNRPQYLLVRALSAVHGNVCVVGDEDQSIYRFRGAELRNILEFERDHPGATIVRLEQNYRSSGRILQAAGAVISRNVRRIGKTLWTENSDGEPLQLFAAPDDRLEASWIAGRVRELSADTPYDGMAVLYRTNAQSRQFEEVFRRESIPYQIVGSLQFYERKEIKDVLAYLRLAVNPADDVAFRRIVNTPSRGIGSTTLKRIEETSRTLGVPLAEASRQALGQGRLGPRAVRPLSAFLELIEDLGAHAGDEPVPDSIRAVVERTGYEAYLRKTYGVESEDRIENVRGLVSAAVEYEEEEDVPSLEDFLDRSALVADTDELGERPGVTLMTVHCAKGLEYPLVFLAGLEESLFPHGMSLGSEEDVEEERRLCYVAMTRAQRRLVLTHAMFRRLHGAFLPSRPSRFLEEIPQALVEEVRGERPADGFWGAREPSAGSGSSAARAGARRRRPTDDVPVRQLPDPGDGFAVGAFVRHPRFGDGRIIGREGAGKHLKLTIQFSSYGAKKILPSYTKLQVRE